MPLRVWRTDDVLPLLPHPNDPARPPAPASPTPGAASRPAEFLTRFTLSIPAGTPARAVGGVEARRAQELAGRGRVLRLWTLPGDTGDVPPGAESLRDAGTGGQTTPLSPHPSDPALTER
jgi:muconolactone delta-isomerase